MRLFQFALLLPLTASAERINHEGRLLGELPEVTSPLLFNTAEADAVISALQHMPPDNPWNEDISQRPLLANSADMIARVKSDLAAIAGRQNLRLFSEMNYVLVPNSQPRIPLEFFEYPEESDLDGGTYPIGLYPIPANMPIEGWPVETGDLTNAEWQVDIDDDGGDRHSIVVMPGTGEFWETWQAKRTGTSWEAANGAKWNLDSNGLRPPGWTSADAGGLPMFAALVRFDECQRGMVEHALRLIVKRTRTGPIYPATHQASVPPTSDPNVPAMGQRFRLKSSFAIPETWTIQEKAVLRALKKYGAIVADNGNFFSVSIAPDDRFPPNCFTHIRNSIDIDNFEVVQTTGPTGGPRSPGVPSVDAGEDQWVATAGPGGGASAALTGMVSAPVPISIQWMMAAGPAAVAIADVGAAATTVTFAVPGSYTMILSAADGVHTVSYDAVVIEVALNLTVTTVGSEIRLEFPGAAGFRYRVEKSGDLTTWQILADGLEGNGGPLSVTDPGVLAAPGSRQFYRAVVLE